MMRKWGIIFQYFVSIFLFEFMSVFTVAIAVAHHIVWEKLYNTSLLLVKQKMRVSDSLRPLLVEVRRRRRDVF